jgi:hypothetical protein
MAIPSHYPPGALAVSGIIIISLFIRHPMRQCPHCYHTHPAVSMPVSSSSHYLSRRWWPHHYHIMYVGVPHRPSIMVSNVRVICVHSIIIISLILAIGVHTITMCRPALSHDPSSLGPCLITPLHCLRSSIVASRLYCSALHGPISSPQTSHDATHSSWRFRFISVLRGRPDALRLPFRSAYIPTCIHNDVLFFRGAQHLSCLSTSNSPLCAYPHLGFYRHLVFTLPIHADTQCLSRCLVSIPCSRSPSLYALSIWASM